jgi:hypothetical protein
VTYNNAAIERAVLADLFRPCQYNVAGPCMHPKCLEAHYQTLKVEWQKSDEQMRHWLRQQELRKAFSEGYAAGRDEADLILRRWKLRTSDPVILNILGDIQDELRTLQPPEAGKHD